MTASVVERVLERALSSWEWEGRDLLAAEVSSEWFWGKQLPFVGGLEVAGSRPWMVDASDAAAFGEADLGEGRGVTLVDKILELGLDEETAQLFADSIETVGALSRGDDLATCSPTGGLATPVDSSERDAGPDLAARKEGASAVLDLVGTLTQLSTRLDAALLGVVSDLTVRHGCILLAKKGAADPAELTNNQRSLWRSRSKSTARREIAALTGWGEGEVSDLVGLANAPATVAEPVKRSMSAGVTPWRLARRFFREFGSEAHEDAEDVAEHLFGTDPTTACTDRLDPDGGVKTEPWEHKLFYRAVEAEATKLASRDPQSAADQRQKVLDRRDARVTVHDDGTGSVTLSGTAAQVIAVGDRLSTGAASAKAAGDTRPLANLRSDLGMSLLMHSGLALPAPPDHGDALVRTEWSEQMHAVLLALPTAVLNVIVPFDAFVHSPNRPVFSEGWDLLPGTGRQGPGGTGRQRDASGAEHGAAEHGAAEHGSDPSTRSHPAFFRATRAPGGDQTEVLSAGYVTGAFPHYLTPDAVRELALAPGTTLHRLLTDPADGRCVERSIAAYAPDAAMRAQVHAADVTCRAPGCVKHSRYTQLDHVVPFSKGGQTTERNLQSLHTGHHDPKTQAEWTAVMDTNRDVTWTSLLGRIYRTRAHDYRQYSTLLRQAVDRVRAEADEALTAAAAAEAAARAEGRPTGGGIDGRGERRTRRQPMTRERALADAADRAVYRALTYRGPARPLRGGDDYPDADTDPAFLGWDAVDLTHTGTHGRRRRGPQPDIASSERDAQREAAHPTTASTGDRRTSTDDGPTSADGGPGSADDVPPPPPPF